MTNSYNEASKLFPFLARYKKLLVALVGTTGPFLVYLLTDPHSAAEIVSSATAYILLNFGIYEAKNAPSA